MGEYLKHFWNLRFQELKSTLEVNHFEVHITSGKEEAKELVLGRLIPQASPKSISWGGSVTFIDSGLYDDLKHRKDMEVLDTFDPQIRADEKYELRRRALLVDLFITGTNAVTDTGKLVNLDMIGNRVGALTFGPREVIVLIGRNKIISDVDEALMRIKNYVAPANVARLKKKNPCAKTGYCEECQSLERICNSWTITENRFPGDELKSCSLTRIWDFESDRLNARSMEAKPLHTAT